jgi:hypothetical protein
MPEQSISGAVEHAYQARRQQSTEPEATIEDQHAAEAARLDSLAERTAQRAEGKRLATVRRALLDAVDSMPYGRTIDTQQQARIVEQVSQQLGGLYPKARAKVSALVSSAADSIADGMRGSAWSAVDDAAEAVAATSPTAGADVTIAADDDDDLDPASLAARIPR